VWWICRKELDGNWMAHISFDPSKLCDLSDYEQGCKLVQDSNSKFMKQIIVTKCCMDDDYLIRKTLAGFNYKETIVGNGEIIAMKTFSLQQKNDYLSFLKDTFGLEFPASEMESHPLDLFKSGISEEQSWSL